MDSVSKAGKGRGEWEVGEGTNHWEVRGKWETEEGWRKRTDEERVWTEVKGSEKVHAGRPFPAGSPAPSL